MEIIIIVLLAAIYGELYSERSRRDAERERDASKELFSTGLMNLYSDDR